MTNYFESLYQTDNLETVQRSSEQGGSLREDLVKQEMILTRERTEIIQYLIEKVGLTFEDFSSSSLEKAVYAEEYESVRYFIERFNLKSNRFSAYTSIEICLSKNHLEMVKYLIEKLVNRNFSLNKDSNMTLLEKVFRLNNRELINYLSNHFRLKELDHESLKIYLDYFSQEGRRSLTYVEPVLQSVLRLRKNVSDREFERYRELRNLLIEHKLSFLLNLRESEQRLLEICLDQEGDLSSFELEKFFSSPCQISDEEINRIKYSLLHILLEREDEVSFSLVIRKFKLTCEKLSHEFYSSLYQKDYRLFLKLIRSIGLPRYFFVNSPLLIEIFLRGLKEKSHQELIDFLIDNSFVTIDTFYSYFTSPLAKGPLTLLQKDRGQVKDRSKIIKYLIEKMKIENSYIEREKFFDRVAEENHSDLMRFLLEKNLVSERNENSLPFLHLVNHENMEIFQLLEEKMKPDQRCVSSGFILYEAFAKKRKKMIDYLIEKYHFSSNDELLTPYSDPLAYEVSRKALERYQEYWTNRN